MNSSKFHTIVNVNQKTDETINHIWCMMQLVRYGMDDFSSKSVRDMIR